MQNTSYLKYLKLSFVVLLAMLYINFGIKNVSYAISYTEFIEELTNKVNNLPEGSTLQYNVQKFLTLTNESNTGQYWVDTPSIAVYFNNTKASSGIGRYIYIYFINDTTEENNFRLNPDNIYFNRQNYTLLQMTLSSSKLSYDNKNITSQSSINLPGIGNSTPTSRYSIFLSENKYLYTNTNYNVIGEYYFNELLKSGPTFEKYTTNIDYDNNYTLLGKLKGEDIYIWRTRAVLYQNNEIKGSYNEIGLGGNVENNMTARKIDNDIYLYVRTSLLYPNKLYSLDVYYDEDNSILEFNENYTFSLESGDNGYTSQNSTNDIINNQNQNTDNIVNAIESGNNFFTAPLDLSGENITSGDIIGALDMNFSGDPYTNVWTTLIDGLRNSLVGVDRDFDVEIFNKTYNINLDSFSIKLPPSLKIFLTLVSSSFMIWIIIRWIKLSIDKVQTANIDTLLQQNEEERNN